MQGLDPASGPELSPTCDYTCTLPG